MSAFDFTPILCVAGLILLALVIRRQIIEYHRVPHQPRTDQRTPRHERELLGLDYRDHVRSYFRHRADRDQIIAEVVNSTQKTGAAPLARPTPRTPGGNPDVRGK